jgi:hypothetical protein
MLHQNILIIFREMSKYLFLRIPVQTIMHGPGTPFTDCRIHVASLQMFNRWISWYFDCVTFEHYNISFAHIMSGPPMRYEGLQILEERAKDIRTHRIKQCNLQITEKLMQLCNHPVLFLLLHGHYLDEKTTNTIAGLLCFDESCSELERAKHRHLYHSIEDV